MTMLQNNNPSVWHLEKKSAGNVNIFKAFLLFVRYICQKFRVLKHNFIKAKLPCHLKKKNRNEMETVVNLWRVGKFKRSSDAWPDTSKASYQTVCYYNVSKLSQFSSLACQIHQPFVVLIVEQLSPCRTLSFAVSHSAFKRNKMSIK